MSTGLNIKVDKSATQDIVYLVGTIDEDSDFSAMGELNQKELLLDLEGISFINSCGIREWIKYLETIDKSKKIIYRKCPQVIIEQMNIVKGFIREGGEIESFYAPYYDESNDSEVKILLTPKQIIDGKAPVIKNEQGEQLEFDDIEAQYFNFLKNI